MCIRYMSARKDTDLSDLVLFQPLLIDGHGASTKNGNIGSFHIERGELFVQEATSSSSKKAVIRLKDYNGECGEDGPLNFYDVTKTINSRCVPSRGFRAPPWKRWKLTFEHEGSIGDFYSCGGIIYYGKASVPECTKVSIFVKNNCW
ncbi:hypothetical protein FRC02_008226 [Tulasnella sp. 418]|nr:hypothetical protein FRC02_008226 [Tulasnella sp. 418]